MGIRGCLTGLIDSTVLTVINHVRVRKHLHISIEDIQIGALNVLTAVPPQTSSTRTTFLKRRRQRLTNHLNTTQHLSNSSWNKEKTKTALIALFVIWSAYFVVEYL